MILFGTNNYVPLLILKSTCARLKLSRATQLTLISTSRRHNALRQRFSRQAQATFKELVRDCMTGVGAVKGASRTGHPVNM